MAKREVTLTLDDTAIIFVVTKEEAETLIDICELIGALVPRYGERKGTAALAAKLAQD